MIGHALESIADQTYEDVEIVVVDDGSTDDTADVVDCFAQASSRPVTYFRQENRGCAAARNRGLKLAKGEFLAFLDSDDAWVPTAAESLVRTLEASGADFVYSPAIEVLPDGSERVNYPVAADHPEAFAVEHFKNTNVRNGAFMFRRWVLSTLPGLDESLKHNEDSDFLQRVAIHYRAAYSSSSTVRVYHHRENKSQDRIAIYGALIQSAQRVLDENPAFREQLGQIAGRRLRELRTKQVEALVLAERFREAQTLCASSKKDVSALVRLAASIRSTIPLKVRDCVNRWKRFVKRRLRPGLKRKLVF
jgi:glycosyltransferase involved in cell wall biosynthesis